jgi:phage shock protein E
MKVMSNFLFIGLLGYLVFSFFIKNHAEADAKSSYESFQSGKAVFIDVREAEEVKEGMIKGALWIPLSKLQADPKNEMEKIRQITSNKEIFVYCRSGNRSGKVQSMLKESGISSVNMGGYSALVKESLPTQKGPE